VIDEVRVSGWLVEIRFRIPLDNPPEPPNTRVSTKNRLRSLHLQDVDMMREAIEECAGESFRAEDRSPLIEWQVTGDERGAAFIALAEHPRRAVPNRTAVEWHVAEFVDDQQLDHVEVLLQ